MALRTRLGWITAAALLGAGQLLAPAAVADDQLHNITYIARIDGVSPGAVATFRTGDGELNSSPLSALPGRTFEANTVLDDPAKAGIEVQLQWPYSVNVHCEIVVDDAITVQLTEFVATAPDGDDAASGALTCGAPVTDTPATEVPVTP